MRLEFEPLVLLLIHLIIALCISDQFSSGLPKVTDRLFSTTQSQATHWNLARWRFSLILKVVFRALIKRLQVGLQDFENVEYVRLLLLRLVELV